MSNLVSFTCGACEATLSISVELAGISGPCPYCGTEVASPRACRISEPGTIAEFPGKSQGVEQAESFEPRSWFKAQRMSNDETVLPLRPRRTGVLVAAGLAVFAGGVAGAWKLWDASEEPKPTRQPAYVRPADTVATPRAAVLATAVETVADNPLPPPSEEMPRLRFSAESGAVARDVSTSTSSLSVPVSTGPVIQPESLAVSPRTSAAKTEDGSAAISLPAVMSDTERQIREVVSATGHLEKPGTALVRFFAAATWQERLKYSLAPDKMKPLMEAHYKVYSDGPIIPEEIELTRIEPVEEDPARRYFAYIVYLPGQAGGVPLSIEETKSGCLVEWRSFIEGKERMLADFFAARREQPATFRVLARRTHYFENDVPDQEQKVVYDLFPPESSGPYKMWVDKNSVAYSHYFAGGQRADWRISSMMVVTLQWERNTDGSAWVRLQEVLAESWHPAALPAGGVR